MRSETCVAGVGAYHVALTTVVRDLAIELESFYTGHDKLAESHVTHLLLAPSLREFELRPLVHSEVPVVFARRRCVYDHFQRLQDFLAELGYDRVRVDFVDEALLAIEV